MKEPIYFSKIEFRESLVISPISTILLNIPEKELSYQHFNGHKNVKRKRTGPCIIGTKKSEWNDDNLDYGYPALKINNYKTEFSDVYVRNTFDIDECEPDFFYSKKLSDKEMSLLLPYCNANDFEPYRNRETSMFDPGFAGYRDEISLKFRGITDSHIPYLEIDMNLYYDEDHIWPSEKLYRYIIMNFIENNKKIRKYATPYGGYSLFF